MAKKRKPVGYKVPCKKGETHGVSMTTGICRHCEKYIMEPTLSRDDLMGMQNTIARAMN